jgi:hypothetical protein
MDIKKRVESFLGRFGYRIDHLGPETNSRSVETTTFGVDAFRESTSVDPDGELAADVDFGRNELGSPPLPTVSPPVAALRSIDGPSYDDSASWRTTQKVRSR